MGSLDNLENLHLGMGLTMSPDQTIPAKHAALDGLDWETITSASFRTGLFVGLGLGVAAVILLKRYL
jgi:hypothetical protein